MSSINNSRTTGAEIAQSTFSVLDSSAWSDMRHRDRLSKEQWWTIYKKILLTRMCEEKISADYFQDHMKTPVHLGIGGEAISASVHTVCPEGSKFFGTYRNHAIYLSCSNDTDGFFGEMYGKITGCAKGKAGSMHMSSPEHGLLATSAVVGTTIPLAVGAALADQMRGLNNIAVVFFGDGAMEEGVFYESMNYASLKGLPVLFVCEDNSLAIHSHRRDRMGWKSTRDLVAGFNVQYGEGDGTDLTDVAATAQDVISRMRETRQPGFLRLTYFRFLEHVGPLEDFKFGYREKPQHIAERFDPVQKAEAFLINLGFKKEELSQLRLELAARIDKSVKAAIEAPFPGANELYTDVWAADDESRRTM